MSEDFENRQKDISSLIREILDKEFEESGDYLEFLSRRKEILENVKTDIGDKYREDIEGVVNLKIQEKFKYALKKNISYQDRAFDLVFYEKKNLDKVEKIISDDEKNLNQYLYIISEVYDEKIESIFSQAIESANKIFEQENEVDFEFSNFERQALKDTFLPEDNNTFEVFLFFLDEVLNDLSLKNSDFKSIVNLFRLEFDIFRWLYLEKEEFYKSEKEDILMRRFEIFKTFFNTKIKRLLNGMMVVNISDLDGFKGKIKEWFNENKNIILHQQEEDFIHYVDNFEIKVNFEKGGGDINLRWDIDLIRSSSYYQNKLKNIGYSRIDGKFYKNESIVSKEEFKKDMGSVIEELIKIKKESLVEFYSLLSQNKN